MNETAKTLTFVILSGALAALALFNHFGNQSDSKGDFELVGKPFFEDFQSTADAASLEVMAVDPSSMSLQRFSVRNDKGTWRIPSHHNYPAEAAGRLAETASSVIGITRLSVEGSVGDFERLGVVDPLEVDDEKIDDPADIGKRITLRDANGDVLVDLIIGKPAGEVSRPELDPAISSGASPATYFYVRRPDEQQVYKALIDIKLSTKFSDWIDPDLLRVNSGKILRLDVNNYELTEQREGFLGEIKRLYMSQGDRVTLNRASFTDAWNFDGLIPEKEELNLARIQSTLEILSELAIAGVRPKYKFNGQLLLTADLKFNDIPELQTNRAEARAAVEQFQDELEDRGFSFAGTQEKLEIASANGQLQVGTDEGVLYTLYIGKAIEGTEKEIEIGGAKSVEDIDTPEEHEKIANYREEEKSRYVMISASFDESLLGARPVKPVPPVEPTKPEGYTPAVPDEVSDKNESNSKSDDGAAMPISESTTSDNTADESTAEKQDAEEEVVQPIRDPSFVLYDDAMAMYEQDKIDYELALTRYEEDVKLFEERASAGKKLVDELNQRFGDWYYVIKGSNLRTLQLKRADIVQPRADREMPEEPSHAIPEFPNLDYPDIEGDEAAEADDGNDKTAEDSA
jgi:hypothetical protein